MSTPAVSALPDDLLAPQAVEDPYTILGDLREADPVHWSPAHRAWLVTRYDDVMQGFRDPRLSSDRISGFLDRLDEAERAEVEPAFRLLQLWHVFMDPPDHTRLRRLVQRAFTPRMVAAREPRIRAVVDELLTEAMAAERFDLIQEVAYPLPAIVIAEMLGVPPEDRDLFKGWSDDITALVFGDTTSVDRHGRASSGMQALADYLQGLVERSRVAPGDDLLTELVQAHDGEDRLSEREVVATCALLLFGGHETTTNLIASGALALLQHPDQLEWLRAHPDAMGGAVDEILRFDGPAKLGVRIAVESFEWRRAQIAAGDRVFLCNSSANRDPEQFDRPDDLVLDRTENMHIGFGFGLHYCLGASLARLEGRVALERLVGELPGLALADESSLSWHPTLLSRGLHRLELTRRS